jgi:hypothetical protein
MIAKKLLSAEKSKCFAFLGFGIAVKEKADNEVYSQIAAYDGKYEKSKKKDEVSICRFC